LRFQDRVPRVVTQSSKWPGDSWNGMKSAIFVRQKMVEPFSGLPEATGNTGELSARLEYTLVDLGYEFPRYPVPEGETMDSFLRKRTEEGLVTAINFIPETAFYERFP
jgi:DNA polymerase III alpha subunit